MQYISFRSYVWKVWTNAENLNQRAAHSPPEIATASSTTFGKRQINKNVLEFSIFKLNPAFHNLEQPLVTISRNSGTFEHFGVCNLEKMVSHSKGKVQDAKTQCIQCLGTQVVIVETNPTKFPWQQKAEDTAPVRNITGIVI